MAYTYFVMTPGTEVGAYIQYPGGEQGVFFKFGDTNNPDPDLDIRPGYRTHNPDIGIAALLANQRATHLGTDIKNALIANRYFTVPGTEWFSVRRVPGWRLFATMRGWDHRIIDDRNFPDLVAAMLAALNAA